MVNEKTLEELETLDADERIKKLKEIEQQKEKELGEIKDLIDKNIRELGEEGSPSGEPQTTRIEEEEIKSTALEDVVSEDKTQTPAAAVEYGRPITKGTFDIGSLYEEVKRFRDEAREILAQGYELNPREEGEFYQLKQMVQAVEVAQSYVKGPKVQNELLNITEAMLESIQSYEARKTAKKVVGY